MRVVWALTFALVTLLGIYFSAAQEVLRPSGIPEFDSGRVYNMPSGKMDQPREQQTVRAGVDNVCMKVCVREDFSYPECYRMCQYQDINGQSPLENDRMQCVNQCCSPRMLGRNSCKWMPCYVACYRPDIALPTPRQREPSRNRRCETQCYRDGYCETKCRDN